MKLDSRESERSLDLPLLFYASYEEQLCVLGVPAPYLTIHILTWLYKPKPAMLLLRAVSIQLIIPRDGVDIAKRYKGQGDVPGQQSAKGVGRSTKQV